MASAVPVTTADEEAHYSTMLSRAAAVSAAAAPSAGNGGPDNNGVTLQQERVRAGQCPSCGQQLYLHKKKRRGAASSLLRYFGGGGGGGGRCSETNSGSSDNAAGSAPVINVPLSIPGLVERGQCMRCCRGENSNSNLPPADATFSPPGSEDSSMSSDASAGAQLSTSATSPSAVAVHSDHNRTPTTSKPATTAVYSGPFNECKFSSPFASC